MIDDDEALCALLSEFLHDEGYRVTLCHRGKEGLVRLHTSSDDPPDMVILDVMMPDMNGFDVLKAIRQTLQIPVLILTARGEDVDSIVGLELGADDYLAKPFNTKVLLARLRAILRRTETADSALAISQPLSPLIFGDITIHIGKRTATIGHTSLPLTSTEFSLLEILARHSGIVVSKSDLFEQALGRTFERNDRSLDMHISNLRNKLGRHPTGEERIITVRGSGYQLSIG